MLPSTLADKEPKDLRYRRLYFPHAEGLVFETSRKGFVPLPIIMRKLMRHLSTPEFRVLVYLHLRVSKYGICYPTAEEFTSLHQEARSQKADFNGNGNGEKILLGA
jgi:hypothetical protein